MKRYEVGQRYGRLLVIELIHHPKNPKAKCICDCGSIVFPQVGALGNGRAQSCGCMRREKLLAAARTHGMSKTPEYGVWRNILDRCYNERNSAWHNYGGRGIKCEWATFEEFIADMGKRPNGMWIDRIDNDRNYSKDNCEWKTPKENQKNKRVSREWCVKGKVFDSSSAAAKFFGIDTSQINRWCNGFYRYGKWHPPKENCWSKSKYDTQVSKNEDS